MNGENAKMTGNYWSLAVICSPGFSVLSILSPRTYAVFGFSIKLLLLLLLLFLTFPFYCPCLCSDIIFIPVIILSLWCHRSVYLNLLFHRKCFFFAFLVFVNIHVILYYFLMNERFLIFVINAVTWGIEYYNTSWEQS